MALVRSDPFRDIDRFLQQFWVGAPAARSLSMPMDAYRKGDRFLVSIDLPGVDPSTIDLTVEDNVLTVKAERPAPEPAADVQTLIAERPSGTFTRQLLLGENLDTSRIEAEYEAGVLSLAIPVAEHAKPRRIEVRAHGEPHRLTA
ncbi:MAG: Hsp20/alpha crystallin family protein [Actinomycetota bacterium]|nr:Hsp20/alpha crystallin family protein [Actinomycetota bacterium]